MTAAPHATTGSLDRLLAPRSVALLGASSDPRKFGGRPLASLKRWGFEGELHVVNPKRDEIQGVPCARDVRDLPEGIDLAVVILPADAVLDTLEACAERGFGAAAVFSGGFAESGAEGEDRQRHLRALLDETGLRLLGPNTPGFVNLRAKVAPSASAYAQRAEMFPGRISFAMQSGAIAGIIADRAFAGGIGVNEIICTGNEADVNVAELLHRFADDPETDAVGLFLEGLGHDRSLVEAMESARRKGLGIVALKGGRSEQGRRVIASHTGSIVGDEEAFEAICRSLGVIRARSFADLLEATQLLAAAPRVGRRIAVVGSSGGMNTVLVDAATDGGIHLPELTAETVARLAEITPDFGSAANPVDISSVILIEPERLAAALAALGDDPGIDAAVVTIGDHPPDLSNRFASILGEAAARAKVPVVVQWSAGELSLGGIASAGRLGVPVLTEPDRCMWALGSIAAAQGRPRRRASVSGVPGPDGAVVLSEHEVKELLERAGISVPRRRSFTDPADAVAAVDALGGVAVLKADCVGPVHKTGAGALRIGVRAGEAAEVAAAVVEAARETFGADRVYGILAEEMVEPVMELVVSVSADDHAGPLITVGAGGELVELLRDTVTRLAPVDAEEALEMIGSLRSAAVLDGFRGRPRGDARAAAELVARLSQVAVAWGERLELLELNPVAVLPDGAVVLDAVVELGSTTTGPES